MMTARMMITFMTIAMLMVVVVVAVMTALMLMNVSVFEYGDDNEVYGGDDAIKGRWLE